MIEGGGEVDSVDVDADCEAECEADEAETVLAADALDCVLLLLLVVVASERETSDMLFGMLEYIDCVTEEKCEEVD